MTVIEWFTASFGVVHGALIWLLGGHRPMAAVLIGGDLLGAVFVVTVLPRLRRARQPGVRFLGVALPLLMFYLFYLQTGLIDVSAVRWRDAELAHVQQLVLTRVPLIHPAAVRDWFILAYFSYDVFLAAGVVALFVPGNAAAQQRAGGAVRRICYALALCYVVGLLFPALSPRFVNPRLQLAYLGQGAIGRMAALGQRNGMVPGTSFPSAHVAAVVPIMRDLWRDRRMVFWLVLPLVISMIAGTVLLLFHYVPDVVAGALAGVTAMAVDRRVESMTPPARAA